MLPGTSDKIQTVQINIDVFLINNIIKNSKDAYRSKRKTHSLIIGQEKTIKRIVGGTVAGRTFLILLAINSIYKSIRSIHF